MAEKEEFDDLHNKVRRYVVKIRISGTIDGKEWAIVSPGIIILKEDSFCYIVAHKDAFSFSIQARYEVVFPDNNRTTVEIKASDVRTSGSIATFFIFNAQFETDMVQEVRFSSFDADADEVVYTLCFERDVLKPSYLSPGLVNSVGLGRFTHDCRPNEFTSWGSPVFSGDGRLVGICHAHRSVILAYNLGSIAEILLKIHGIENKPIAEIKKHIKGKGEAVAGAP